MGWSHSGNTRQKYQHYYADDAVDALLTMMDGLMPVSSIGDSKKKNLLKPKQCPNCDETNTPESRFCVKCKFVLSFELNNEATKEAEEAKRELAEFKAKQEEAYKKGEKRQYEIGDMQEKLKKVQEQIERLPDMLLRSLKIHEPELVEQVKDKERKTTKQILLELPKPKTFLGEALLSSYALENYELLRIKNLLQYSPEKAVKVFNDILRKE
jgi:hypothetical protein